MGVISRKVRSISKSALHSSSYLRMCWKSMIFHENQWKFNENSMKINENQWKIMIFSIFSNFKILWYGSFPVVLRCFYESETLSKDSRTPLGQFENLTCILAHIWECAENRWFFDDFSWKSMKTQWKIRKIMFFPIFSNFKILSYGSFPVVPRCFYESETVSKDSRTPLGLL